MEIRFSEWALMTDSVIIYTINGGYVLKMTRLYLPGPGNSKIFTSDQLIYF